ncbi:Adenylate kinase 8, partial [Quaeritorhiza haematococci]
MDGLILPFQTESIAHYADQHNLFELFQDLLVKIVIEKPEDAVQFMIDYLKKPHVPAICIGGPPTCGLERITEAAALKIGAVHIKAGDLLRVAIERQTSLGMQAKPYVEKSQLVPDAIITSLVLTRLQDPDVMHNGFVLVGFPCTRGQAHALQKSGILPSKFVLVDVPDDKIIKRTAGIRIDPVTNRLYHLVYDPPPKNPIIENRLVQKQAHTERAVRTRLEIYRRHLPTLTACFPKTLQRLVYPDGVEDILGAITTKLPTRAPREFKIVISGRPGCGKTTLAEKIQDFYGFVHVSPQTVMIEEISGNSHLAEQLEPFIQNPENAPQEIIQDLICHRLKRKDCIERGWILDGFPTTTAQAEYLRDRGILPNRVIWLGIAPDKCALRLTHRRFHPQTNEAVNLNHLPPTLSPHEVATTWIQHPRDTEDSVRRRFEVSSNVKTELIAAYKWKVSEESHGIVQELNADMSAEHVFEQACALLARPVPVN